MTRSTATAEPWTTRRLLTWMTERFESKSIPSPRIVAEMLLAHVVGCDRLRLYMEADRPASPAELDQLRTLVVRAAGSEPVQYLTGRASFFSMDFEVDDSTLIPQPCTEVLVEFALARLAEREGDTLRVADIGTGSGCIAVAIARRAPRATCVATDVVPAALELARRNATRYGVADRIEFREGNGLEPLAGERFDVVCSNPPYISDAEWESGEVERSVMEHVPVSATRGGVDGFDVIGPLLEDAGRHLAADAWLVCEITPSQRDEAIRRATAAGLAEASVHRDGEGHWRTLVAKQASVTS